MAFVTGIFANINPPHKALWVGFVNKILVRTPQELEFWPNISKEKERSLLNHACFTHVLLGQVCTISKKNLKE